MEMDEQEDDQLEDAPPEEDLSERTVPGDDPQESLLPPQPQNPVSLALTICDDTPAVAIVEGTEAPTAEDDLILDRDTNTASGGETPATQLMENLGKVTMDSPSAVLREGNPAKQCN